MTRNEAVALVKQGLGFRTTLDSTIITNMQAQQQVLEMMPTKPWFLLSDPATLTLTTSIGFVTLPTDFLDEYEEGGVYYLDDNGYYVEVEKGVFDILQRNFKYDVAGPPQAYALVNDKFYVFPLPDDSYTLSYTYYSKDTVLNSDIENNWLKYAPQLLIGKTGAEIAAGLRDFKALEFFEKKVKESSILLENQNEARKMNNLNLQMGGPH